MKIHFKTVPINGDHSGWTTISADLLHSLQDAEYQKFLSSLTSNWTKVPSKFVGLTTSQNFLCYVRLTPPE